MKSGGADLGILFGSEPGFRRPVVIIQNDAFNRSKIQTVIVSSISTNLKLSDAPGNIYIEREESGLPKNGVINISQISTLEKKRLTEKIYTLPPSSIAKIDYGLKLILNIQ